ncbi:zinc finger domain-containing protein, partial [Veillonella caviae]|nr:isoleucine--tRNA ligase [Veillonella caviae]
LSFTAEEVWKYMPKEDGMPESVMLIDWPQGHPEHYNQALADKWNQLLVLRSSIQKALETARQNKTIGHPLDASITVYASGDVLAALEALGEEGLAKLVIVSEAHISTGEAPADAVADEDTGVATVVTASELEKCERCWIHRDSVGADSEHPTLCHRCAEVVKTLGD